MIDVMIVEDNETIRKGLALLIDATEGYRTVGEFEDCETMLPELKNRHPDVLLMDIRLPGMSGIEGIKVAKKIDPDILIIMLTIYEESDLIFQALCSGAVGYLVKKTPPSQLLEAIKEAYNGGSPMSSHIARKVVTMFKKKQLFSHPDETASILTNREKEILNGLAAGQTYQAVGFSLHISIDTVRFHIRNIYKKLHVHSVSEAVAKAIRRGIL
jgi:DNA-binding NarL/FixJ family response regulator